MSDALTLAAVEHFRNACDDNGRDSHPDTSVPRATRPAYDHLRPWHEAAARWSWRRATRGY